MRGVARRPDWLVAQLPMGMLEDDFFARFAALFQEIAGTLLDDVDNLDNIVDHTVAPTPVVRWLGTWLGISDIDSSLPDELQRRIVREWGRILAWRGTTRGLVALLELLSGGPVTVSDTGGIFAEGGAQPGAPTVTVEVESTGWVADPDDFVTMVLRELPAQVLLRLTVGGQRLWPPESAPDEPPPGSPALPTYHPPSTPDEPEPVPAPGAVDPWPAAIGDEWGSVDPPEPAAPAHDTGGTAVPGDGGGTDATGPTEVGRSRGGPGDGRDDGPRDTTEVH